MTLTIRTKRRRDGGRWLHGATDYAADETGRIARTVDLGGTWRVYEVNPETDNGIGAPSTTNTAEAADYVARSIVAGTWR